MVPLALPKASMPATTHRERHHQSLAGRHGDPAGISRNTAIRSARGPGWARQRTRRGHRDRCTSDTARRDVRRCVHRRRIRQSRIFAVTLDGRGMIAAAKSTTSVAEQLLEKAAPLRSIVSSRGRIAVKSG